MKRSYSLHWWDCEIRLCQSNCIANTAITLSIRVKVIVSQQLQLPCQCTLFSRQSNHVVAHVFPCILYVFCYDYFAIFRQDNRSYLVVCTRVIVINCKQFPCILKGFVYDYFVSCCLGYRCYLAACVKVIVTEIDVNVICVLCAQIIVCISMYCTLRVVSQSNCKCTSAVFCKCQSSVKRNSRYSWSSSPTGNYDVALHCFRGLLSPQV